MAYGLDAPVLVLNKHYQPVRVTRARRALTLLYVGAAQVLDANHEVHDFENWAQTEPERDDEVIGTTAGWLRIPRLVLLSRYGRIPATTLRLSRRNVYLRDDYTCQYCAAQLPARDLNLDHVTPRAAGGRASWENLVTSCRRCNFKKGSRTPEAAGMRLLSPPRRPSWSTAAALAATPRRFAEWEAFLYWPYTNPPTHPH
ncbi:MAG: HNH endonuclease, partial [Myxococcales bacterium]|nr:HNH endonuclease [Myxococcales bacterium]